MRVRSLVLGAAWVPMVTACAPPQGAAVQPILPLHTLVLYETGIGYFERAGVPLATGATALPVPASHLDDALKTLVVLGGEKNARVHEIEWKSSIGTEMARALAGLSEEEGKPIRLAELLAGLKGGRIAVERDDKPEIVGRLIDVTFETVPNGKGEPKTTGTLLLMGDDGALVRVDSAGLSSVRPLEADYESRLTLALGALAPRAAETNRPVHVWASGGPVTLGYIAETPVWRATYRLLLGDKDATLQGWALVHNDTEEDWHGVRLSLANGRPDSFLFPLAAPRYARRELVTPDDDLRAVPQLFGTTVDKMVAEGQGGTTLEGYGSGNGRLGEGIGLGSFGTLGHGAGTGTDQASSLLEVGDLARVASAAAHPKGALFLYALRDAVDLASHSSALLPFTEDPIDGRRVAWLEDSNAKPRSAVVFVNSTDKTLPAGTLSLFEAGGGFAGESALVRLEPGQRRFVTFGADLDVEVDHRRIRWSDEVQRVVVQEPATLVTHFLRTSDDAYTLIDRARTPRTVVVETDLNTNAKVTGADRTDYDEARKRPLVVFDVPAAGRVEKTVHAIQGLETNESFANLISEAVSKLAHEPALPAQDRAILTAAGALLAEAEAADAESKKADDEVGHISDDIERLSGHMRAWGSPGATGPNPFAARVLAAEDRMTAAKKKRDELAQKSREKRDRAGDELRKLPRME